jgi:hypothetical protein
VGAGRPHDSRRGRRRYKVYVTKGVIELQFQIKGQDYFLAFVEDERKWYLFSQTANEVQRILVYVDVAKWDRLPLADEKPQKLSS